MRLRLTGPEGSVLPDVVLTIVNDDLGFMSHASRATPNGRFLLKLTGHRGRASLELQRSTDLIHWQRWWWPFDESQWLDAEGLPPQRFYRLLGN